MQLIFLTIHRRGVCIRTTQRLDLIAVASQYSGREFMSLKIQTVALYTAALFQRLRIAYRRHERAYQAVERWSVLHKLMSIRVRINGYQVKLLICSLALCGKSYSNQIDYE